MKRALMYASVASMIQQFNMNNIKLLIDLGYKVDVACNFEFGSTISNEKIEQLKSDLKNLNVGFYHIPVPRKITDLKNIKESYKQSLDLFNKMNYDLIHCHSPIGGLICRIANKNSNNYTNCKLIYTAHGFHFFKGNNPVKNFIFKNIERYGAKYTDILITINKEDYDAAKKFKLKNNGKVEYVPGVGIDLEKINSIQGDKKKLCKELNIPENSILLLSVGELNENKNHKVVIDVLPSLPENIHYIICGTGKLYDEYIEQAKKLNVESQLHLLGYRDDVIKIMKSCDIFIFPSKREGLSVALMEAMACGLPCIVSNIRGNKDLINDNIFEIKDLNKIERLIIKNINMHKKDYPTSVINRIDCKKIMEQMKAIY
ncbi:glycosyltransferase [Traorella massiliensis]|uniref:glycosyltransferase n=1 Tax=Traorella massiliensis TaxID=1903263 RepID=UPI00248DD17E|nr:glycosyltransferase [Traorella massiliensis]